MNFPNLRSSHFPIECCSLIQALLFSLGKAMIGPTCRSSTAMRRCGFHQIRFSANGWMAWPECKREAYSCWCQVFHGKGPQYSEPLVARHHLSAMSNEEVEDAPVEEAHVHMAANKSNAEEMKTPGDGTERPK